jgi:hypothetical protein
MTKLLTARERWKIKVWYPDANDLPLMHIPEDARAQLRERLAPSLQNMRKLYDIVAGVKDAGRLGIAHKRCWEITQGLAMTANDPTLTLVEGVWIRRWALDTGELPSAHTWAVVDGHRVDLLGEFYAFRSGVDEFLYEPFAEYRASDLSELCYLDAEKKAVMVSVALSLSTHRWKKRHSKEQIEAVMPEHLHNEPSTDELREQWLDDRARVIETLVFKPATDRLMASNAPASFHPESMRRALESVMFYQSIEDIQQMFYHSIQDRQQLIHRIENIEQQLDTKPQKQKRKLSANEILNPNRKRRSSG